jgi:hypothetical protein
LKAPEEQTVVKRMRPKRWRVFLEEILTGQFHQQGAVLINSNNGGGTSTTFDSMNRFSSR